MNAAAPSKWLFALALGVCFCGPALAQDDDPFGAPSGGGASAQQGQSASDSKPAIIRKVEETPTGKAKLLPFQRKEIMQRLIREIQDHLDARENLEAEEKLAQLLDLELSDFELRDIRRRFSRFLNVETDQRVLEIRRRKPEGTLALTEAMRRMLDIQRPDEAQRYLAALKANNLTAKDYKDIYALLGESYLRSLIRDRKMGSLGAEFAQEVIDIGTSQTTNTSPVVQALRNTRLNTPADQLDAIDKLLRYGAVGDAREIAEQLAKREMTPDEMAALHRRLGSAPFLMLVREKRLGPEAAEFANKVLTASELVARDPAKLSAAAEKLLHGDAAAQRAAAADLLRGGEAAAAVLLKAGATAQQSERVEKTLAQLGERALPPLVAALYADKPEIRELAARSLARTSLPQVRVYLLGPLLDSQTSPETRKAIESHFHASSTAIPTQAKAIEVLRREWNEAMDALRPGVLALDAPIYAWTWSTEKEELVYAAMTEGQARRLKLAQAAAELLEIAPDDNEVQRLAAMSLAEAATADAPAYRLEDDSSWATALLKTLPPQAWEQGLVEAVRRERVYALLGLLQMLGTSGDERLLIPTAGEQRIVTRMLSHPHPRVRAQAVDTVLKLAPTNSFAGSSQVIEALRGLVQMRERPSVFVVDPKPSRARQTAMLLRQAGWEAVECFNEQELTRRLSEVSNAQIVLVSEELGDVNGFVQRLRREPRLALAPVGVMAKVENLPGVSVLSLVNDRKEPAPLGGLGVASEVMLPVGLTDMIENPKPPKNWLHLDRMTRAVPYAMNEEVLARVILQLSQLKSDAPLDPQEQLDLAVAAVRWMGYIASNPGLARIFDLASIEAEAIDALNHDALAADAAPVVGYLGTPKSQAALINLASQAQRDIALRRAAADAFRAAVEKRGLLLTQGAIALQYDRYNQSRDADRETIEVLGAVLDAIEIPWKKRQALSVAPPP